MGISYVLTRAKLAKAGFFYHPSADKPDNTACFLCHRGLDGWDEDDDPLVEHLKHSPDCAWALVEAVETQIEEFSQEYPASKRLLDARKATFGNQWPHETKKGWKCKTKQVYYTSLFNALVANRVVDGRCWLAIYTYK
jgi:hypothetical protein